MHGTYEYGFEALAPAATALKLLKSWSYLWQTGLLELGFEDSSPEKLVQVQNKLALIEETKPCSPEINKCKWGINNSPGLQNTRVSMN